MNKFKNKMTIGIIEDWGDEKDLNIRSLISEEEKKRINH